MLKNANTGGPFGRRPNTSGDEKPRHQIKDQSIADAVECKAAHKSAHFRSPFKLLRQRRHSKQSLEAQVENGAAHQSKQFVPPSGRSFSEDPAYDNFQSLSRRQMEDPYAAVEEDDASDIDDGYEKADALSDKAHPRPTKAQDGAVQRDALCSSTCSRPVHTPIVFTESDDEDSLSDTEPVYDGPVSPHETLSSKVEKMEKSPAATHDLRGVPIELPEHYTVVAPANKRRPPPELPPRASPVALTGLEDRQQRAADIKHMPDPAQRQRPATSGGMRPRSPCKRDRSAATSAQLSWHDPLSKSLGVFEPKTGTAVDKENGGHFVAHFGSCGSPKMKRAKSSNDVLVSNRDAQQSFGSAGQQKLSRPRPNSPAFSVDVVCLSGCRGQR